MGVFGETQIEKSVTRELEPVFASWLEMRQTGRKVSRYEFFADPFVNGYVSGVVDQYCELPDVKDMAYRLASPFWRGGVLVTVEKSTTGSWPGIFGLIQPMFRPAYCSLRNKYAKVKNPDWLRGADVGNKLVLWKYGAADLGDDSEVASAIEFARTLSVANIVSTTKDPGEVERQMAAMVIPREAVTEHLFDVLVDRVVWERFGCLRK